MSGKYESVFAWTATEGYDYYPPYLNISVIGGEIVAVIRGAEEDGKCGPTACINLPRDQMLEIISFGHKVLQLTKD